MIVGSAGSAPRNYVDCRDVAAIAGDLLLSDQPPLSAALTLTGPEAISYPEMAERIAQVIGSRIRYDNLARADHYRLLITRADLAPWLAQHIVELEELARRIPEPATNSIAPLLAQYPRTMDEFLHEHRQAFLPQRAFDPVRMVFGRAARPVMLP